MLSVTMRTCQVGHGFVRRAGRVVTVSDDEAARLIAAGLATKTETPQAVPDGTAAAARSTQKRRTQQRKPLEG